MKHWIKKLVLRERASSEDYINYLVKKGVKIGKGTRFYAPKHTNIDVTRPYMVEIGEYVHITHGVTMLTHGYDWAVIRGKSYDMYGSAGPICIGNNVFIGANSTILKDVTIGDNVIIGAGSLVNKSIPSDCVAAGNPVRVICSLEEYAKKREQQRLDDAVSVVKSYRKRYGVNPPVEELYEFFWLFEPRIPGKAPGYSVAGFNDRMRIWEFYPMMEKRYGETNAMFEGYDAFLTFCEEQIKKAEEN
ncbi:MAG: acyltransferase [Lachnospiraceae bacterium]|nr:acyltransferase [Lachnospiraceae bacterium]